MLVIQLHKMTFYSTHGEEISYGEHKISGKIVLPVWSVWDEAMFTAESNMPAIAVCCLRTHKALGSCTDNLSRQKRART